MKTAVVLVLTLTFVNAYVIERLGMPCQAFPAVTVLEDGCGCSSVIDYGYSTIMSSCGCVSDCGCPVLDRNLFGYETSICQGPFSPVLDMGVAYPLMGIGSLCPDIYEIAYPRPACGCGLVFSDCTPIPPLPPVIGCPKYLRQITLPPPFL